MSVVAAVLPPADDFTAPSQQADGPVDENDRAFYITKMAERAKGWKPEKKAKLMLHYFGDAKADLNKVAIEKLHALYVAWEDVVREMGA